MLLGSHVTVCARLHTTFIGRLRKQANDANYVQSPAVPPDSATSSHALFFFIMSLSLLMRVLVVYYKLKWNHALKFSSVFER